MNKYPDDYIAILINFNNPEMLFMEKLPSMIRYVKDNNLSVYSLKQAWSDIHAESPATELQTMRFDLFVSILE